MFKQIFFFLFIALFLSFVACKQRSPEKLPKLKEQFKTQIASFEKEKEKANEKVTQGMEGLSGLQKAIQTAKNSDKEFNRVYGYWDQVDKRVKNLNEEYELLRRRADTLFAAIERQVSSLDDEATKRQLLSALDKSKMDYDKTLVNTEKAIEKLRKLHKDAFQAIKALEAAVAIGQIGEINQALQSIQGRVDEVMKELSMTVEESQKLYHQKMGGTP